jgi:hypothetical protein
LKAIHEKSEYMTSDIITIAYTARGHGNSFGWEESAE